MKAIEKTIISEELIFSTPFIFANMSRTSIQSAIEMSECRLEKYNAKEKIFLKGPDDVAKSFVMDSESSRFGKNSVKRFFNSEKSLARNGFGFLIEIVNKRGVELFISAYSLAVKINCKKLIILLSV